MNAPSGQKHCATCDEPIDDAQAYCSESCARVAELNDRITTLQSELRLNAVLLAKQTDLEREAEMHSITAERKLRKANELLAKIRDMLGSQSDEDILNDLQQCLDNLDGG
jgi:predicted nucleic acid-binding Zn ribbon protein